MPPHPNADAPASPAPVSVSGPTSPRLNRRCVWLLCLGLGLAALGLRVSMLAASVAHVPVTVDESITVLQAKRIREGERPLLVMAQPYQFPLEAYFSAPLVHRVPRNTWGARYVVFIEGFIGLALLVWLARRVGTWRDNWPTVALILFPSAYLLMIQFGYSLPHNSPFYLAGWIALLLTVDAPPHFSWGRLARFVLAGLLCGLAFANNMLALAMIAPILLAAGLQGGWRHVPLNAVLLAAGVWVGLWPFRAAIAAQPGAHAMVAGTRPLIEALSYAWNPGLTLTLPRALGVMPTSFPDNDDALEFATWLAPAMPYLIAAVLLAATGIRAVAALRHCARHKTVDLRAADVFVGIVWLNLALFALSERSDGASYRYLAPAAWSFPFLVGAVYAAAGRWLRAAVAGIALLLVAVNLGTTVRLIAVWRQPDFALSAVNAPDLTPTFDYLKRHGIRHAVATHWHSYRINFLTDETLLCSQPYNERFTGWPLPYKDTVDAATNVAYLLTDYGNRGIDPALFDAHLQSAGVTARKAVLNEFSVYHDFRLDPARWGGRRVPSAELTADTSHYTATSGRLVDGDRHSYWSSEHLQESNMWVRLRLAEPCRLTRIVVAYGEYAHDRAPRCHFLVKAGGGWHTIGENVPTELDPFAFENGHPVYARHQQVLNTPPVWAEEVLLIISEPDPHHAWTLAEVELFAAEDPPL